MHVQSFLVQESRQLVPQGTRCRVWSVTLNRGGTITGDSSVILRDGGSAGTQRHEVTNVGAASVGRTFQRVHDVFEDGLVFESGLYASLVVESGDKVYVAWSVENDA